MVILRSIFFREHARRIEVILLDMTLPGPGGREIVAEAVRLKPGIRVILTSAYSHEIVEGSMTAPKIRGFMKIRGFIRQPVRFVDLLQTLRSSLST
jgi:CheY-like chemotaxis protein